MRFALAGLALLFVVSPALAQAEGEVEAVGIGGYCRPNCWTGLRLKLRPKTGATETYTLQVIQEDLDGDHVAYTRPFTLNGNPEGRIIEERVWVYFLPQPRGLFGKGLPLTGAELDSRVRVYLCKNGRQLVRIPFQKGLMLTSLDEPGRFGASRGARFVLVVCGSDSQPLLDRIYAPSGRASDGARGLTEQMVFLRIAPRDLPGNVLGYQAVDAIVWLNADPTGTDSDTMAAVQDYVRDGGRMLVCHSQQWQKINQSEMGSLLPVTVSGQEMEAGAMSLRKLAGVPADPAARTPAATRMARRTSDDPWDDLNDRTCAIGRATPKAGADTVMTRADDPAAPYLARWMYGLGTVTWAAQDFGDPTLISSGRDWRRYIGWDAVWDVALDLPNATVTGYEVEMDVAMGRFGSQSNRGRYEELGKSTGPTTPADVSSPFLGGMELGQKSAAYVALVVLFFILYWAAAGLGSFLFLRSRQKTQHSWPAFAVCAIVATGVTGLLVKAILRGPAELQHVTFLRVGPDRQAVAHSQFGLYIPRDGVQRIRLPDSAAKRAGYVAPYPLHPSHVGDSSTVLAYMDYEVPVRDRATAAEPEIDVPYRSTLKKFQARWTGRYAGGIDGRISRSTQDSHEIYGKLVNASGVELTSVSLVYRPTSGDRDTVLYQLSRPWRAGDAIAIDDVRRQFVRVGTSNYDPAKVLGVRGNLTEWTKQWDTDLHNGNSGGTDRAALLASIFDRVPPSESHHWEMTRTAGRHFDASGIISSGHLLVVAKAESAALPFALDVAGERVKGNGVVYFQFAVPIERTGPATRPYGEK